MTISLKLNLNVTRDDLDNGIRKNTKYCPIALAVNRELFTLRNKYTELEIYEFIVEGSIKIQTNYGDYECNNSFISEFTGRYDEEDFVSPFEKIITFHLIVDDEDDNDA